MFCLSAITTHPLQRLRADSWHVAGAAWARGVVCALLALLLPLSPAVAQPGAAAKPAEAAATDSQTGQQGDDVVQNGALGALCQREGQRDEDDEAGIDEDRHGHHKAGDAQCPCRLLYKSVAADDMPCVYPVGWLTNRK